MNGLMAEFAVRAASRMLPGGTLKVRLNARQKAASDW
jgi:hypothetical protein